MTELRHSRTLEVLERYFGIARQEADSLINDFETVDVASGDWLFRQDDPADSVYFLVRGRLQVWINAAGEESHEPYLAAEVAPGESVGEVGLLTGGVRSASLRAIRDSP